MNHMKRIWRIEENGGFCSTLKISFTSGQFKSSVSVTNSQLFPLAPCKVRKCLALTIRQCVPDSADSVCSHSACLPLYLAWWLPSSFLLPQNHPSPLRLLRPALPRMSVWGFPQPSHSTASNLSTPIGITVPPCCHALHLDGESSVLPLVPPLLFQKDLEPKKRHRAGFRNQPSHDPHPSILLLWFALPSWGQNVLLFGNCSVCTGSKNQPATSQSWRGFAMWWASDGDMILKAAFVIKKQFCSTWKSCHVVAVCGNTLPVGCGQDNRSRLSSVSASKLNSAGGRTPDGQSKFCLFVECHANIWKL